MPRDGSLTPRDLVEKIDALVVACDKCGRSGRYRVLKLAEQIGRDGKLTDWLYGLTKDCPRKQQGTHTITHKQINDARHKSNEHFLYFWGIVQYNDGFADGRTTKFCHRYNLNSLAQH